METRNLTCIGCPMGCPLTVKIENGTVLSVEGNTCKRGAIYGKKEVTDPTRIVTVSLSALVVYAAYLVVLKIWYLSKHRAIFQKIKFLTVFMHLKILLFLHLCISEM